MPEIATKFTVHPTDSLADQILIAGVEGYRYRIIEWFFQGASGAAGDMALYFGPNRTDGRYIAGAHHVIAGIGWSPRAYVGATVASVSAVPHFIPYPSELWTGYEAESIGLYSTVAYTWQTTSFLTYEKIPVAN